MIPMLDVLQSLVTFILRFDTARGTGDDLPELIEDHQRRLPRGRAAAENGPNGKAPLPEKRPHLGNTVRGLPTLSRRAALSTRSKPERLNS